MKKDALDVLREWIKEKGPHFGTITPTINIKDGVVMDVRIKRGDETIFLAIKKKGRNLTGEEGDIKMK